MKTKMRLVYDQIWIGNSSDAKDQEKLKRNKIANILNVAFDLSNPHHKDIGLYKVGLCDGPSEVNPVAHAVGILGFLVIEAKPCLVHCHAGKSRSPLVVTLFMCALGHTLEYASRVTDLERKPWMDHFLAEFE